MKKSLYILLILVTLLGIFFIYYSVDRNNQIIEDYYKMEKSELEYFEEKSKKDLQSLNEKIALIHQQINDESMLYSLDEVRNEKVTNEAIDLLRKVDFKIEIVEDNIEFIESSLKNISSQSEKIELEKVWGKETLINEQKRTRPYTQERFREAEQTLVEANYIIKEVKLKIKEAKLDKKKREYSNRNRNVQKIHSSDKRMLRIPDNQVSELEEKVIALESKIINSYPSFPDPVPRPSVFYTLGEDIFENNATLGDVQNFLDSILSDCDYEGRSYFKINSKESDTFSGFAVVAQLERINKDAYPLAPHLRWKIEFNNKQSFSIDNMIKVLFGSNPGYYRTIVFHVSNEPFVQETRSEKKMKMAEAQMMVSKGASSLAQSIQDTKLNRGYKCNLLVYEFEIPESGNTPFLREPSLHTGEIHISRSGLEKAIKERVALQK